VKYTGGLYLGVGGHWQVSMAIVAASGNCCIDVNKLQLVIVGISVVILQGKKLGNIFTLIKFD